VELKNALAVCLISFFSATLVLLIARALDMQAASQLQPQLAEIVEELRALRKQGGLAPSHGVAGTPTPAASPNPSGDLAGNPVGASSAGPVASPSDEVLVVYYFHGAQRCVTCRLIESQARETVERYFSDLLRRGTIVWKTVNYDSPSGAALAQRFKIAMPMVVLATESGQQITRWKSLDSVWPLAREKEAFVSYVREEIKSMLPVRGAAPSSRSADQQPSSPRLAAEGPSLPEDEPALQPRVQR
jgi:hypothetical protein